MAAIIPKLGFRNIKDSALGEYAQDKIDKITAAPAFAAVVPSAAAVQTKKDDYEAALVASDNGTTADTANPDTSVIKEYIVSKIGRKQTTLGGLPSGQKVFVRVRANGGSTGQGAWSDVAEKRVP